MNGLLPGFSILIVDDEKSNLEVLNHILKPMYTVYVAKSGQAALKRAHTDCPDLILLDVVMPDMDGFEVLAKLKESDITCHIPVIFITGLDSVDDEERGFFLGAVDYITKPFHSSIVKARVETHLKIIKQMRTIERFGLIDALTEIPNKQCFDNQITIEWGRSIREGSPLSMLIINIDKFKYYNDTYGHPNGDALLKAVANSFGKTLKRTTDLVFRWGGDTFTVILPNTDISGALAVAENIRTYTESSIMPCLSDGHIAGVTLSIGAASITPTLDSSIPDFILEADKALCMAKETGGNTVKSQ